MLLALVLSASACAGMATSTRTPAPTPAPSFVRIGRTQGNPNARVTLVVYADFQCPYSRQFAQQVLPRLMNDYIVPGKISFTYKYFPVIDDGQVGESHWAAQAAECANEQNRFWDYHDKLYTEQRGANIGAFTRARLKTYATELKLDLDAFNRCLDTDRYATLVREHLIEALQIKLPGTPTFLLNGRKMNTPTLGYTEFWKPLEEELKQR
ncbi:MAG: DsbA family protein [Anaerolineae bacterium]|nr:DsbA family protein [Anaerolineae bacterium]